VIKNVISWDRGIDHGKALTCSTKCWILLTTFGYLKQYHVYVCYFIKLQLEEFSRGWSWGLNPEPASWATPPVFWLWWVFWVRVLWAICPGWLWTEILLISASWVARITGLSHQHLDYNWKNFDLDVSSSLHTNYLTFYGYNIIINLLWY
jgi:hypothetical protein